MQCDRFPILQKIVTETPETLESPEWQKHLEECANCRGEVRLMKHSLDVYLQLENPENYPIFNVQIWDQLQSKLESNAPFWQRRGWQTVFAAAAAIAMLIGVSSWLIFPTQDSGIPARYKIVDITPGEAFGSSASTTRVLWSEQQFGLSIEHGTENGNYSAISIGMRLSPPQTQGGKSYSNTSGVAVLQKFCFCRENKGA